MEDYLSTGSPEVTDFESFVGLASPFDFNGMVRHYYMRRGPSVADIRVNLVAQERARAEELMPSPCGCVRRSSASRAHGAKLKIVETPPGPPVFATLVAEVYGPVGAEYAELIGAAKRVRSASSRTPAGLVDIDDTSIAPQPRIVYRLDRTKAGLHGIAVAEVAQTLAVALGGSAGTRAHIATERTPLEIVLRLPRRSARAVPSLPALKVRGTGRQSRVARRARHGARPVEEQPIYRKDLRRFAMVTADTAGRSPVNAVLDMHATSHGSQLARGLQRRLGG